MDTSAQREKYTARSGECCLFQISRKLTRVRRKRRFAQSRLGILATRPFREYEIKAKICLVHDTRSREATFPSLKRVL